MTVYSDKRHEDVFAVILEKDEVRKTVLMQRTNKRGGVEDGMNTFRISNSTLNMWWDVIGVDAHTLVAMPGYEKLEEFYKNYR